MDEALNALGPLDGRYRSRVEGLRAYFSEAALIRYRVRVEVEYLVALSSTSVVETLDDETVKTWRDLYVNFDGASRIKEIEKVTNHDVKAVEYYLKENFGGPASAKEFIHFGLTSQDINNIAQPLALAEFSTTLLIPRYQSLVASLKKKAWDYREVPMLARTHGQAATPTRLGKEFAVFATRLEACVDDLVSIKYSGKFGGATGSMNAHYVAFPKENWEQFADDFVVSVSGGLLSRQRYTTQIEHYDNLAKFCHALCRANVVILDLCKDCWQYVSLGYFGQKVAANEVGSSAMPHKVNPIDFENGEGNLGVANALLTHLAEKLPISRLQRDLTDSTVMRTLGTPLGHSYLAVASVSKGLEKLTLNQETIDQDLENNWAVVAEAIQTVLRREAYPEPYEALKKLTRGQSCTKESFQTFIDQELDVSEELKDELKRITPQNYLGHFNAEPFRY